MQCTDIEVLLSGYIDSELTQQQQQRVCIHVEQCAQCSTLLQELKGNQERTRQLTYQQPSDGEWQRMERHLFQKISRGLGWLILLVWSAVTAVYAAFQLATSPTEPLFEKILVFSLFLGVALLFLSVLSERVRDSRTDPYKGVRK